MTDQSDRESRWRLIRDVLVFQIKLGMEAVLDITLIPVSLAAAGLDLLLGNWRRPRWFHAVLRFGERCEHRINLWGISTPGVDAPQTGGRCGPAQHRDTDPSAGHWTGQSARAQALGRHEDSRRAMTATCNRRTVATISRVEPALPDARATH